MCIHEFTDDNGDVRGAELKLNVICRAPVVQGWRISLKLHRIRVDGIDHEGQYDLPDGSKAHGWHRHVWDEKAQHGDDLKQPLETFGKGLQSKAEFLIRACREMRIIFNKSDDGNGILQFD